MHIYYMTQQERQKSDMMVGKIKGAKRQVAKNEKEHSLHVPDMKFIGKKQLV